MFTFQLLAKLRLLAGKAGMIANDGIEDTEEVFLPYPSFVRQKINLIIGICALLQPLVNANLANQYLLQLLFYGDKDLFNSLD